MRARRRDPLRPGVAYLNDIGEGQTLFYIAKAYRDNITRSRKRHQNREFLGKTEAKSARYNLFDLNLDLVADCVLFIQEGIISREAAKIAKER